MKSAPFLCALILAAATATTAPLYGQEKKKGGAKEKAAAPEKTEKPAKEEKKDVTAEAFGDLALGRKPAEVEKVLGKPESKGKKIMQEATGTSVQDWNYPAKGLTVTMEFAGKIQTVGSLRATAGCTLATARGIKIGSTEAEVAKAYAKERDAESSKAGESFVAGSVYGGVIFTLKDGKVSEIFIGAAAE